MDIKAISKAWWTNAEARDAMATEIACALVGVKEPIGTTALLKKMGVDMADAAAVRNCLAHVANCRKMGLVDGLWTAAKASSGTRGYPSYKWRDTEA